MEPFSYTRLSHGEIRVLRVFTYGINPDATNYQVALDPYRETHEEFRYPQLRCRLIHTTLRRCSVPDSFFAYYALSYVWGGPRRIPIDVNGRKLFVSSNLANALVDISRTPPIQPYTHHMLWVDALCINQEDNFERGNQVQLMREIYDTAKMVIIWLGGESLSRSLERARQQQGRNLDPIHIDAIFRRPWFRRIWVVQEAAFAKEIQVMAGSEVITWHDLLETAQFILDHDWSSQAIRISCSGLRSIESLRQIIRRRRRSTFASGNVSIDGYIPMEPINFFDLS